MINSICLSSLVVIGLLLGSCDKKEKGVCYCSYYGGNRTVYDLKHLPKQQQTDSCQELSRLASGFAGSCKIKN